MEMRNHKINAILLILGLIIVTLFILANIKPRYIDSAATISTFSDLALSSQQFTFNLHEL